MNKLILGDNLDILNSLDSTFCKVPASRLTRRDLFIFHVRPIFHSTGEFLMKSLSVQSGSAKVGSQVNGLNEVLVK